jgi:hypothetical protein
MMVLVKATRIMEAAVKAPTVTPSQNQNGADTATSLHPRRTRSSTEDVTSTPTWTKTASES